MARLLKTFEDIYTRCANELKIQVGNTTDVQRLQTIIQEVYLDQVTPAAQWKWLRDFRDMVLPAAFNTGTASVTEGSPAVTLTDAPTTSAAGYWFSVRGSDTRYRVAEHAAGSTSVVLEAPFAEETTADATFDLWCDRLTLPVDWREVPQILNDQTRREVMGLGMQKYRERELLSPKTKGTPEFFTVGEFVDPAPYAEISGLPALSTCASSGNIRTLTFAASVENYFIQGQRIKVSGAAAYQFNARAVVSSVSGSSITYTASQRFNQSAAADGDLVIESMSNEGSDERYRELYLYPSLYDTATNLHLMGIKEAPPLIEDEDEPLMPISDRNVLVYGALAIAWASIGRNPTEAARNQALFDHKLSGMQAELSDTTDVPQLQPSPLYLAAKRGSRRRKRFGW